MTSPILCRATLSVAIGAAALLSLTSSPSADQATCEADARAAMLDVNHAVPMRQDVTTEMGGAVIVSAVLSTPDGRGVALDANDTPTSMWIGGRFYTSTDGGATWSLLREQSQEELDQQAANREKQAEDATAIDCEYDLDLDGRTVNRFSLEYVLIGPGTPITSQYWVDAETSFPWRVVHEFGGDAPSVITQQNTPQPDLTIADPDG